MGLRHCSTLPAVVLAVIMLSSPATGVQKRNPAIGEILSGKALNELLADLAAAHAGERRGPRVALEPKLLERINVAPPGGGNFGLLRNGGKLPWPAGFDRERLRGNRETVGGLALLAVRALTKDPRKGIDPSVLAGLEGGIARLRDRLIEEVHELSAVEYIQAKRFLIDLSDAVRVLKSPAAGKFLDGTYTARGQSVGELVDHLRRHGLVFVGSLQGQEQSYQALYRALAIYHADLTAGAVK